jgi:hypothetical protein
LTNLGSDGRALANKGAVPFGVGINGAATTCAVFAGSTSQALYIPDSGAADPFRIRTGSWGCWFRTAKRGTAQFLIAKSGGSQNAYRLFVNTTNVLWFDFSLDGAASTQYVAGVSDVADDRWHFGVATCDGTAPKLYVDGVMEAVNTGGIVFASSAPVNIGAAAADASTAASGPNYGRMDEAFVTADVLTEDQIRCLYAAKLAHTLGVVPTGVRLNVHRRRKGAALAPEDFSTQPLRLYNFTAGALTDQGSNGQALTNNGGAVSVAGADGTLGGGFSFAGAQSLSATDAGLPGGTAARSYGCWFKTTASGNVIGWGGTVNSAETRTSIAPSGALASINGADAVNGPFVADGQWHFVITVEDNAAGDGVRRKCYLDGRLVAASTVLNSITLTGANRFRIGQAPDATSPFTGQIDGAFVTGYALTVADVATLYAKASQDLGASPKEAGAHVERLDASSVLFVGDTLESQWTCDLAVVA